MAPKNKSEYLLLGTEFSNLCLFDDFMVLDLTRSFGFVGNDTPYEVRVCAPQIGHQFI